MRSQCSIASATLRGVEALPVTVEVAVSNGMPGMAIVGMPDTAVQEARERVRAAISAAGFTMPTNKIVVNLAPADLRKTGSGRPRGRCLPRWRKGACSPGSSRSKARCGPCAACWLSAYAPMGRGSRW